MRLNIFILFYCKIVFGYFTRLKYDQKTKHEKTLDEIQLSLITRYHTHFITVFLI